MASGRALATRLRVAAAFALLSLFAGCAAAPVAPDVAPELAPFVGHHRGELRILGDRPQTVPMELLVEPIPGQRSALRFVIGYGAGDRAQRRDYRLLFDEPSTGRCRVDEQNGIVLGGWLADGELVFAFTVDGHTTVVRYRAVDGGVDFALEALQADRGAATGHGVTSHDGVVRQRARLRRATP